MRMRLCYQDCHEAGLSYYIMMHMYNLLRPLQLFYFHLWPIYWLSRVDSSVSMRRALRLSRPEVKTQFRWKISFAERVALMTVGNVLSTCHLPAFTSHPC
jgi:hypothetical protein